MTVISLGVFDQDVSARLCLKNPLLYQEGTQNVLFNWPRILGWMCNGFGSSVIIFFCTTNAIIGQVFQGDGQVADYGILSLESPCTPVLSGRSTAYMVFVEACAPSLLYWLSTVLVVVSSLLPYFSYRTFKTRFQPMPHDIIQRHRLSEISENEDANVNENKDSGELDARVKKKLKHLKENLRRKR
ncbi:hypothetical protein SAY86_012165 [Trapa natans]|uniref:P-type ATPase C-terminal domain-containing protein n=1 Tax=Trapa natans TaxID=22666 RepID=A0AAN7LWC3_TRANT|nr:hypothetical protein SAY86_012165 [Trapa natans]